MKRFLTLCFFVTFQLVRAQTPASPSAGAVAVTAERTAAQSADEKAVLAVEKQRFEAQMKKDYAVLDQVLANDLVYTHSSGKTDTKQAFIQSIREDKLAYNTVDIEEQKVRMYGNVAVINGMCMTNVKTNGEIVNLHLKYTDVYVRKGSQWQLVVWQSTRLAQ